MTEAAIHAPRRGGRSILIALGLMVAVVAGFYGSSVILLVAVRALQAFGVSFSNVNSNVLNVVLSAILDLLWVVLLLIGFRFVQKRLSVDVIRKLVGLTRLPQWRDFLYFAAGLVLYFALWIALRSVVILLVPAFDATQPQVTGFSNYLSSSDGLLVFLMLVVIAPVFEEFIFRGYLFGLLRRRFALWIGVVLTSLTFAFVHLQLIGGPVSGWNVALDVFCLSLVSCLLREYTKSLWASILLHMTKNAVAFVALYVVNGHIM